MIKTQQPRYHHLDALRAFAMLLGVMLHGMLSYFELPIWPAQDIHQHPAYGTAQYAIHGFRLPLFFLISGYFTTMLWRRRGMAALALHRLKRILLPMVVGWVAFVPLTIVVSVIGTASKESLEKSRTSAFTQQSEETGGTNIWTAAKTGNTEALKHHLENGVGINVADRDGLTALAWASLLGQRECAELLIEHGADINARDGKGNTHLHLAAFLGQTELAELLVAHGADVNAISMEGNTPLDSAAADWWIVEVVAEISQFEVDREEIIVGRTELVAFLESKDAKTRAALLGLPPWATIIYQLYQLGAMAPILFHLWFLYYLLWLVAGFMLVAWISTKLRWKQPPAWLIASPTCLLVLVPLTTFSQFFMHQSFGPDTAAGILPWPPKLFYYALFFGFGALCFGRAEFEDKAGRWWPLYFVCSVPLLFFGLHLFLERPDHIQHAQLLLSICAALYAWLMVYGCLGLFRRFFSSLNQRIRYLSDASYWIYLAHLPLVLGLQIVMMTWPLPSFLKFLVVCALTYGILLLIYRHAVRYTIVGTILNGKKVRVPPIPQVPGS
jgi:peptidoglycan/LPS O-acetylase OafA/YrhL